MILALLYTGPYKLKWGGTVKPLTVWMCDSWMLIVITSEEKFMVTLKFKNHVTDLMVQTKLIPTYSPDSARIEYVQIFPVKKINK